MIYVSDIKGVSKDLTAEQLKITTRSQAIQDLYANRIEDQDGVDVLKEQYPECGVTYAVVTLASIDESLQLDKLCEEIDKLIAGGVVIASLGAPVHTNIESILNNSFTATSATSASFIWFLFAPSIEIYKSFINNQSKTEKQ